MKTRIGKYEIEIRNAQFMSLVTFASGQHGKKERGDYGFWAAVFKKAVGKKRKVWGRTLAHVDAGDRFRRIQKEIMVAPDKEDRKIYKNLWETMVGGKNIAYIRPCTEREIKRWMATHLSDAKHVARISVGGKLIRTRRWT